jgi:predicted Na+-dependent transporter
MPFSRTWVVVEVVIKVLLPIIIGCVLNESREHWFLGKALQFISGMSRF